MKRSRSTPCGRLKAYSTAEAAYRGGDPRHLLRITPCSFCGCWHRVLKPYPFFPRFFPRRKTITSGRHA